MLTTEVIIQIFPFSWRRKFRGVRGVLLASIKLVNHEEKKAISFSLISNRLQIISHIED